MIIFAWILVLLNVVACAENWHPWPPTPWSAAMGFVNLVVVILLSSLLLKKTS